jgi:ubiquinone/menaquinone biosynthesis C-methylase UbiE
MLNIARRENPSLDLRAGSFSKIPFNEKFDIAIAPLVIDHVKDWNKGFKEVKRVLKKGGYFIFSIGNPVFEVTIKTDKKKKFVREFRDYFNEFKDYGVWGNILYKKEVRNVKMPSYHRTYEKIIKIILENGFEIVGYKDCRPLLKSKKLFPKEYSFLSKVPYFCVWKVKKK